MPSATPEWFVCNRSPLRITPKSGSKNAIPLECTGGSIGTSLALACAAIGLPAAIMTHDAFSNDKTESMRAFGADVIIEESKDGQITPALWQRMRNRAQDMHERGTHLWLDQFRNN